MPKYLKRLLLFSLLLGAIPVISLGVISYYIAKGDIETKVKEGNMQVLLQTQMRVEQVMKTLELTSIQYVNSALVTSSISESLTIDDFPKIRDLSKGLYNLQTVAGISDSYLVSFDKDWVVSFKTFGSVSGSSEAETFKSYAKHPNSLFWVTSGQKPAAAAQDTEPTSEETPVTPQDTTRMVYKIPVVPTTSQPKGLLVVELQNNQISNLLSQNNNFADSYVLDRRGINFLSNQSAAKYGDINAMVMERVTQAQTSGFFNAYAGKKELGVTYRQSPYNGWMYVSVVSIDEITKQSRKIAWITFIVCSVIFIIVGLAAFYGSRRMYSPIKRLFEFTKEIEVEGQSSSRDEFTSIEQRFRTLFSTEKQLQQQVKGHFVQLKEFFMLKLFTGQVTDAEFARRAELFGFPSEWKRLGVVTLQIDSLHGTRYREHDRELLLFAINNIVGELIPADRRFSPVLLDQSQVTLLISRSENEADVKQELYEAAEGIKQKVYEFLQLPVSLGISRPFEKLGEAVRAHGEGLEALKSRIGLGSEIILHYDDIEAGKKGLEAAVYMQLKMYEDQLVNAMKLGDMSRVNEQFDKYMAAIAAKEVHPNDYPVLMIQLISKIMQLVQEQGARVKTVLGDRATIDHFLKLGTMEDIAAWFRTDLFKPVNAFLNTQAESQYIDIAGQMVKLIHERFDQDLSLESCAQTLNFHPVYLSRVFKKEIGINFSEYLADYRMNMAKTWLENTNWKISEIAEKLSYTNTTAFIRTFRKIVGTTPGQYREEHKRIDA